MKVYRFTKYNLSIPDIKIHMWKFATGSKAQNFNSTVNSSQNASSGHVALPSSDGTERSDFSDQTGRLHILLAALNSVMMPNYTCWIQLNTELGSIFHVWAQSSFLKWRLYLRLRNIKPEQTMYYMEQWLG
jgi:hypothetical protein